MNTNSKLIFSKQNYNRMEEKSVWISDKIPKQLIRFIVEESPKITLTADVASGASIYVYKNKFSCIADAFSFAREEFERFCRGESLRVNATEEKLGWFARMFRIPKKK